MPLAFLAALPWKDIAWGTVVLGLAAWIYHGGEKHIEAADTKVAVVAEHKTAAAQTAATNTETQSAIIYKQAVAIPAVGDIGIDCVRDAPAGGSLPAPVALTGASPREQSTDSASGYSAGFDPSGAVLTRAAQADAQIAYLQRRVHELETEMNAAP
jgi:hypothetical protein